MNLQRPLYARHQVYQNIVNMFEIVEHKIYSKQFQINTVCDNSENCDNWIQLSFLESLTIKELEPELNAGMKATKER